MDAPEPTRPDQPDGGTGPPEGAPATGLERRVLARALQLLDSPPDDPELLSRMEQRAREVLYRLELTDVEERAVLSSEDGEANEGIEQVLSARIERAVEASIEVVQRRHDVEDASIHATAVELLRGMDASELESARARLAPPATATGTDWLRESLRKPGEEDPLVGSLFHEKYRILRCIGRGGFGAVYEALDERGAQNSVAIKVMLPEAARTRMFLEAFRAEAIRVTRLNHPNIVDWKTFDKTREGQFYFVMELLEGEDLARLLRREGALEPKRALHLLIQILEALRAAHFVSDSESILHLDLKPKNIIVLPERRNHAEQVKVIDFGIGQYVGGEEAVLEAPTPERRRDSAPTPARELAGLAGLEPQSTLTFATHGRDPVERLNDGLPFRLSFACTPEFASPEQCEHIRYANGLDADPQPLDGRADLYSLGILAYRMLTGRLPFPEPEERKDYLDLHRSAPVLPWGKEAQQFPKGLREFVERCLRKDREERFRDAEEAHDALERIARPATRSLAAWIAVPSLLFSAGLFGFATWGTSRAATTLELLAPGGSVLEAGADVFAGPLRPEVSLALPPDRRDAAVEEVWQVVDHGSGVPLEDWSCVLTDARLELRATGSLLESDSGARDYWLVRVESESGAYTSLPFDIRWVGELPWTASLVLAYPEGAQEGVVSIVDNSPTIDVTDAALVLRVRGPAAEVVEAVQVSLGDPETLRLDGERVTPSTDEVSVEYRFALAAAVGLEGPVPWRAVAAGPAGFEANWEGELTLRNEPLEAIRWELQDRETRRPLPKDTNDVHLLDDRVDCQLVLETNFPSKVEWRIGDEDWSPEILCDGETRLTLPGLSKWFGKGRQTLGLRFSEESDVLGAKARHTCEESLEIFVSRPEPLTFQLHRDGESRALEAAAPVYVRSGAWSLRATPQCRNARDVVVDLIGPDGRTSSRAIEDVWQEPKSGALALDQDGEWELHLRTFLQQGPDHPRLEEPFRELAWTIVVDSKPPELALHPQFENGLLTEGMTVASIRVTSSAASGSPITWSWSLPALGLSGRGDEATGRIELLPQSEDFHGSDGSLELQVRCEDAAGNVGVPVLLELERACEPPAIELVAPQQEDWLATDSALPWPLDQGTRLRVVAQLRDPNGLRDARCTVYRRSDPARRLQAEPASVDALETLPSVQTLTWTLDPPEAWSEAKDLLIDLVATDRFGVTRERREVGPFEAPTIRHPLPPRISATRVADRVETHVMRLIEMDPGRGFWLGGRAADIENEAYADAGLELVRWDSDRDTTLRTPWGFELSGALAADFYLDESEVSVGQFLQFLDSEESWAEISYWTLGRQVTVDRREALRARLASQAPDLPVTGVTAQEAAAYAAWAGKRLPTLLELQFAARGQEYRPFAAYDGTAWAESVGADRTAGPRSVFDDCADTTPRTRIRNLDDNVAEWTCSPALDERRAEAADFALDARPAGPKSSVWIAGGYFGSRQPHACLAHALDPAKARSFLGFRCAVSAAVVRQQLHGASRRGTRFEELGR